MIDDPPPTDTSNKFGPLQRTWVSSEDGSPIRCYLGMRHRVTWPEIVAYLAEHHPGVDPDTIRLNFATAAWEELPTSEELAKREKWRARQAERQVRWERETYERLKVKFGEET